MAFLRGHWQLLALAAAIVALWQTPLLVPLKILIVFLHELSHVIAVLLTGGEVVSLSVNAAEGGLVVSRGGSRFVTLSAGYLGSLLIGVALFFVAVRTFWDRAVVALLGAVLIAVSLFYSRDWFAFGFGLGAGVLLLGCARFMRRDINDLVLRVIGLTSMIYVPLDIFSDTLSRAHLRSDARMLAEEIGGTTMLWGAVWLAISLVVIGWSLARVLGEDSNLRRAQRT